MLPTNLISFSALSGPKPLPPDPVAGSYAWWDAADTTTISLNGTKVSQWNDKSGNGRHLSRATDSVRPSSGSTLINGYNVLRFASAQSLQVANDSDWTFLHNGTTYTIFICFQQDSTKDGSFLFSRGGSLSAGPGIFFKIDDVNKVFHQVVGAAEAQPVSNLSTSTFSPLTTFVLTLKSDPDNGTAANRSEIYKNSGSAEKNNANSDAVSSSVSALPLQIGAAYNTFNNKQVDSFQGSLCEIIIYNTGLSGGNITTNIDRLKSKWGVV